MPPGNVDPGPLGVRLEDLAGRLAAGSMAVTVRDRLLLASYEACTVRVAVVAPAVRETEAGPLQAVVQVITDLPASHRAALRGEAAEATAPLNRMGGLGAFHQNGGSVCLGSRLTILASDDAWHALHLPLLTTTVQCSPRAALGAVRATLGHERPRSGDSFWTLRDLARVRDRLSGQCRCTILGNRLSAGIALSDEAAGVAADDPLGARFRLVADQPHPALGGGLLCQLQMPHRVDDAGRLARMCHTLNQLEMSAHDLPPHFGAWCPDPSDTHPAYVSFLPNALHACPDMAVHATLWALHRAHWARAMLASTGAAI